MRQTQIIPSRNHLAALIMMMALVTAGCTTDEQVRGFVGDLELIDSITPGIDNRNSVRSALGVPSAAGTFDSNVWYYVSETTMKRSFFKEKPIQRLVLVVQFDQRGIVSGVDKFGLSRAHDINPENDKTPTRGKTLGFFEQIFGNIGRFAAPGAQGPNQRR